MCREMYGYIGVVTWGLHNLKQIDYWNDIFRIKIIIYSTITIFSPFNCLLVIITSDFDLPNMFSFLFLNNNNNVVAYVNQQVEFSVCILS